MSYFTLITVGKMKNSSLKELAEDYLARMKHYGGCDLIEVQDSRKSDTNQKNVEESFLLSQKIPSGNYVVSLDETGKSLSSKNLAFQIQSVQNASYRGMTFLIGGAYGLSVELKQKANLLLSLSALTLPHELARVVLLEQLYRASTILKGEKYHH